MISDGSEYPNSIFQFWELESSILLVQNWEKNGKINLLKFNFKIHFSDRFPKPKN